MQPQSRRGAENPLSYSAALVSRLRHRYQLATEQYGCQPRAISSIAPGFGSSYRLYAFLIAARIPRSPVGSTFGRRSAKIRNM